MHREAKKENGPGAECAKSTFRKISVKTMRVSLYKRKKTKVVTRARRPFIRDVFLYEGGTHTYGK